MIDGALAGMRVVELGHGIAGPFAARLLGDLGAEVVKVEPPEGDGARRLAPLAGGVSLLFEYLNWNKRGVVADLRTAQGRGDVQRLVAGADVVVESFRPGRLASWGLAPEQLLESNPGLVVTSVSNFGQAGPRSQHDASDLVFQATGGVMSISGTRAREPLKHGLRQSLYCAGLNAAYVSLAAYHSALRTGESVHVDLSIQECIASELVLNEAHYAFLGAVQSRQPTQQDPFTGDPLPAADGWVSLQTSGVVSAEQLAALFDDARLAQPRFATTESRTLHADELNRILAEHLATEHSHDFFTRASAAGFLSGFVQDAAQLLDCPQLEARGVWHSFPELGPVRFPAVLASLSRTPVSVRRRAPKLGEHSDEIGREPSVERSQPARAAQPGGAGPLAGIRVVDLSTVFAVPYLGALLADLGAEVIKVEAPQRLDQTRSWFGPFYDNEPGDEWWNRSGIFQVVNRGKRSLTLDLAQPEGRAVLHDLLRTTDVLLDNFTPRVMRRWGTTYEDVSKANPRLVMLSNTGYGSTGPWAAFRAQGTSLEATMGITHYTGYHGDKPRKAGQSYPDFLACWAGLTALLAALVERERSGAGQHIDLGMYQLGACVIPEALLHVQATGEDLPRLGNEDLSAVLSGLVPAAGDDRWLAFSVPDEERLRRLAELVGADDTTASLARWAAERDPAEAAEALQAIGIAAGPVLDAHGLLTDPHLRTRGFYEPVDHGTPVGLRPIIGRPYRWESSGSEVRIRSRAPKLGEANRYVLHELLGYDADRIAPLRALGVVADSPRAVSPPPPLDLAGLLQSGSLARVDADYVDVLAAAREPL
jgi:crotonobetainyl-CoA:carnitine CoA-transferase CaiB-like acyl-CoA transferase